MIDHAMVLAAGRGERLRPLTDSLPKPLIEIGGKALIDHVLDRLADVGVQQVVVNLSHLGGMIESHLAGRDKPRIAFSREAKRLETGGGVAKALSRLGDGPFYVVNGKLIWRERGVAALARLGTAWDDDAMDALLLLLPVAQAGGYVGAGDFHRGDNGVITARPKPGKDAPWLFTGIQILHPRLFADAPDGAFSLNLLYDRAMADGRLYSLIHDGDWHHVSTPEGLTEAQTWFDP